MTYAALLEEARRYVPAFALDRLVPYAVRHWVKTLSFALFIGCAIPSVFIFFAEEWVWFGTYVADNARMFASVLYFREQFIGGALIGLGIYSAALALDGFYFSLLLSGEQTTLREFPHPFQPIGVTLDVADAVLYGDAEDITASFLVSSAGRHLMERLGVPLEGVDQFMRSAARVRISGERLTFPDDLRVDFAAYAAAVHAADEPFRASLRTYSISDSDFRAAAAWVSAASARIRKRRRWWSRDYLGRTPAFGTSFSYGRAYSLEKYGRYLTDTPVYRSSAPLLSYFRDEAEELETVLVRAQGANAVVVGEDAEAPLLVAVAVARLIDRGEALPPLEHKRFFMLDAERIVSVGGGKALIEAALMKVLSDADRAGNLVVIIPGIGSFMKSLEQLGVNLFSVIDGFLRSSSLHLVALADADSFHRTFERDAQMMQYFERVLVADKGKLALMTALERTAEAIERREHVRFSYSALADASAMAEQLFPETPPLDKATDLITEVAAAKRGTGALITAADIRALVEAKTGVPAAGPGTDERAKLIALEGNIKKRVVGQPDAASAVAAALRRARAGIRNENRPMGTFLFLGPTGVGKTETAKALAESYFGSESSMIRFDMSEYSGADALGRLIGTPDGEPGLLVTRLREKPFSVLLFDEFEKSSPAVRDLFLQLLDEGFITDARGKRAYARSAFIIATSNAGSDEIFRLVEEGRDIQSERNHIIDGIVGSGLMRPELINRFDGVILFQPMSAELTESVARQLLSRFAKRIEAKGYTLVINDVLVKFIAKEGADPKFGARPLNRAIAEKVEQAIADKIIAGDLRPGARIEFTTEDFG